MVDSIERVREVRDRLVNAGTVVGPDGRSQDLFPVAIGVEEGLALREWVREEAADARGWTRFRDLDALHRRGPPGERLGLRHVAADPFQLNGLPSLRTTYAGVGLQVLEEAGVRDRVEFYGEESQIVMQRLLAEGRQLDFVFFDGNHRFEAVFVDLFYSGRLLKGGGIVFVDDIQLPGVRRAVDFYIANLGWAIEDGGKGGPAHEWLVVRTGPRDAFLRPYAESVDF